jgi:hypothetical protein
MARLATVLGIALTAAAAGCITPDGYYRPDGGATATGGAPVEGGATGSAGSSGTGTGGASVAGAGGASSGAGGTVVGSGGSTAGGKGGASALGGATGQGGAGVGSGGASVGSGGAVGSTGAAGSSACVQVIGLPYSDDFGSDTVGAQAVKWTQDTMDSDISDGTFMVVSDNGNQVLQGAATGSDFIMDIGGDKCWTDYTFQVDIKMMTGSSFEFGVFGRFALGTDKGNYYEAYMDDSGEVQLRVRINGSTKSLGSKSKSTTGDAVLGTVYTFVLDMHGGTISVSVNGVARVSMVMDATLTTGGIGVIVNGGTAEFDNVMVTE